MELSIDREDLRSVLERAKSATEKKSALPILNNFLLEAKEDELIVKATDLENFLAFRVKADIYQEGRLAVNAEKLTSITKSISSVRISLRLNEDKLAVSGGRSGFKLSLLDPEDFPEFPEPVFSSELSSAVLLKAIDKVEYAISKEDSRYAMQGLYIHRHENKLHFVGTDGHRLALFWQDIPFSEDLLVPRKSLRVLEGILKNYRGNLRVGKDDSFIHFAGENFVLSVRQLEGEYPDYLAVIPSGFNYRAFINKDDFISALKELSAIAESSAFPVKITFSENNALLQISEPEFGEGEVQLEVDYTDEPVDIGFNGKYLMEALESFDSPRVWFKIVDPDSAVVLSADDEELDPYMCLIMPMRL
ncbi:MAG: DNA polymerase III subunit beta [Aquificota bacterium]|nr:MAG: DNA polymerase III subunit beta [Aquificota bacterium]